MMVSSIVANGSKKTTLTVSAASSLKEALTEIGALYMSENKNTVVEFNFAATGTLQTQIERGAPVDIFTGADYESLITLANQGLMDKNDIRVVAGNTLALIVAEKVKIDRLKGFRCLSNPTILRIAIGNPAYVPAGKYAVKLFQAIGIMNTVQNRLLYASNVRQAVAWVEAGSVDAAIVYGTDAKLCRTSTLIVETTAKDPVRIEYGIGVLKRSKERNNARKFVKFTLVQREIWDKYGFTPGE